jgi:hypothetical protein
LHER